MLSALPVVICLASFVTPPHPLFAQQRYRVTGKDVWLYQQPGGKRLAQFSDSAMLGGSDSVQNDYRSVTLDGWIFAASTGSTDRDGFDLAVTKGGGENVRTAPAGALLAHVPKGFLFSKTGEERRWAHVRRAGWMRVTELTPVDSAETAAGPGGLTPGPRPGVNLPDSTAIPLDSATQAARRTELYRAPEGPSAGVVAATLPMRVISRSGEWTRVQLEGWVKTADIATTPPGVLIGISSAELRADPARYVGQTVRWTLQYIALEKADELRPDMPEGADYLLTRGPFPERGFVYVIVPDARRDSVTGLVPLSRITITARVRSGRSRYIGNPIVDLVSIETEGQP
ncbi:MAG TPA: hypothetical protein VLT79_10125 [Gemmatimonadales bacterium]|nr:hypothetical protein [Gemmatimonadales bacterium]